MKIYSTRDYFIKEVSGQEKESNSEIASITTGSNRSLRSLGRAKARPLTKRYALKGESVLEPVVQEETTGCGIASVANILGKTYSEMKAVANAMGIHASDKSLWSDTQYVRRMLSSAGVKTSADEAPFESWEALPNLALLSIKHHQEEGKDFWHWVVFKRVGGQPFVLDSASYLPSNIRQDFDAMQPKWFIEVENA